MGAAGDGRGGHGHARGWAEVPITGLRCMSPKLWRNVVGAEQQQHRRCRLARRSAAHESRRSLWAAASAARGRGRAGPRVAPLTWPTTPCFATIFDDGACGTTSTSTRGLPCRGPVRPPRQRTCSVGCAASSRCRSGPAMRCHRRCSSLAVPCAWNGGPHSSPKHADAKSALVRSGPLWSALVRSGPLWSALLRSRPFCASVGRSASKSCTREM